MGKTKILIVLEGGLIREVYCNRHGLEIAIPVEQDTLGWAMSNEIQEKEG